MHDPTDRRSTTDGLTPRGRIRHSQRTQRPWSPHEENLVRLEAILQLLTERDARDEARREARNKLLGTIGFAAWLVFCAVLPYVAWWLGARSVGP